MTIIDFMEDQATFDELLSDCRKSELSLSLNIYRIYGNVGVTCSLSMDIKIS